MNRRKGAVVKHATFDDEGNVDPAIAELFVPDTPPSPEYKKRLRLEAAMQEVESRHYEGWEIMRMLNAVAAQRDTTWLHTMRAHTDHMLALMELQARLIEIHSYVARTPGKLYYEIEDNGIKRRVFPFTDENVGMIASELAQYALMVERIGDPVPGAPIFETAKETMNALGYLLNGHDDGERLRAHVNQFSDQLFKIREWVESYPLPGRGKGSYSPATRILGERGLQLTRDQKMTISEAVQALRAELKEYPPTSLEGQAYTELNNRRGKKAAEYLRGAIRRWQQYLEAETKSG